VTGSHIDTAGLQGDVPATHVPALQSSGPLQNSPSSHEPGFVQGMHMSIPSLQLTPGAHGLPLPTQLPAAHVSVAVQKRPSSHVSVLFVCTHARAMQSSSVHGFESSQSVGTSQSKHSPVGSSHIRPGQGAAEVPQALPMQVPVPLQTKPSSGHALHDPSARQALSATALVSPAKFVGDAFCADNAIPVICASVNPVMPSSGKAVPLNVMLSKPAKLIRIDVAFGSKNAPHGST
jgi:hypothetical protein